MPRVRRPIVTFPRIENGRVHIPKFLEPSPEYQEMIEIFRRNRILGVCSLRDPFSSRLVKDFYNSLVEISASSIQVTIANTTFIISCDSLAEAFEINNDGEYLWTISRFRDVFDWSQINQVLHGVAQSDHLLEVSTLTPLANQIQKVLRHTIFQKAGDSIHMNSTLSLVTYFIMTETPFDLAHAFISQMLQVNRMKNPAYNRNHSLVLGHIIQEYISTQCPNIDLDRYHSDCIPIHFRPQDIGVFQRVQRRRVREEHQEQQEQQEQLEEPSYQSLERRFDRLEISVGAIQHDVGEIFNTMDDMRTEMRSSRRRESYIIDQLDHLIQHSNAPGPSQPLRRLHRRDLEVSDEEDSE